MLRVSTRGEYGVRLVVDLARHYGERPRSLTEISQSEGLTVPYLEQLVRCLRENGLVESTRGAHGGYKLSRAPQEIGMGEVVRALEGPIAPMVCATEGEMGTICDRLDCCTTKYLWAHVRDAIAAALDAMTLADLLRQTDQVSGSAELGRSHQAVQQLVTLTPRASRVLASEAQASE